MSIDNIKRFDPCEILTDRWEMAHMEEKEDGDYILYEDAAAEIEEITASFLKAYVSLTDEIEFLKKKEYYASVRAGNYKASQAISDFERKAANDDTA